jgi:excinuclease Cho
MRSRVTSVGLIIPARASKDDFEYPVHIDAADLEALPAKPGVYLFHDRQGKPIYIGKSVNIRSRVFAHLRTIEEQAMLLESHRINFIRTAGEIGALLLEARLIKQWQPAYNVLLKYDSESFFLQLKRGDDCPHIVGSSDTDPHNTDSLHGLFSSRSAAEEGLRLLIRQHGLCPAVLGLETTTHGRACFSRQLGRCRGACIGAESQQTHRRRLRIALKQLQASVWPYDGPIGIIEQDEGWRQTHIVNRWHYIGSLEGRRRTMRHSAQRPIDIDTYKILVKPLLDGQLTIATCRVADNTIYVEQTLD